MTVTLVRMGVGAGYIGETEATEIISDVLQTTKEQYHSWRDFVAGYMIGRAGFTDYVIEPLADTALACLKKADSPWNKYQIL